MATKQNTAPQAEETHEERQARLHAAAQELYGTALKWALAFQGSETTWTRVNPRLGLEYAIWFEKYRAYKNDEGMWWTKHTCSLTEKAFSVPLGAPVPVLFYDSLDDEGKPPEGSETGHIVIHPELASKGTEAIREALQKHVEWLREEAAERLETAEELERMGELIPEKLEVEWPTYWMQEQPVDEKKTEQKLYRVINHGYNGSR